METKGFTQISNKLIFDLDLSGNAFLLYAKIQHHEGKKNFKLNREHVKSISGYGETAFRKAWKELKDKGILVQTRKRKNGKFVYEYDLNFKVEPKEKEVVKNDSVKKESQKPVDSEGNAPIVGQVYIDDLLEGEEDIKAESIELVVKETEFNEFQSSELLKIAKNDIRRVIECYKYSLNQSNVKNIFSYTKWAIKNNKVLENTNSRIKQDKFNDYPQRNYNYSALEIALLGGKVESLYN